jgi:hypothetical protein
MKPKIAHYQECYAGDRLDISCGSNVELENYFFFFLARFGFLISVTKIIFAL